MTIKRILSNLDNQKSELVRYELMVGYTGLTFDSSGRPYTGKEILCINKNLSIYLVDSYSNTYPHVGKFDTLNSVINFIKENQFPNIVLDATGRCLSSDFRHTFMIFRLGQDDCCCRSYEDVYFIDRILTQRIITSC